MYQKPHALSNARWVSSTISLTEKDSMVDRNAAAIADQLLALPSADRARLAQLLLASLEERDVDADALWDAEIERRATDMASGRVAGVAAADVFAEVESRLRR